MLPAFLSAHRTAILGRARAKVESRLAPRASEEELDQGIPLFLDQLSVLLVASDASSEAVARSAAAHGRAAFDAGFTVAQVVHDYVDVCVAITELAAEANTPISPPESVILHRCLDHAIAEAVTEYLQRRERALGLLETERLGALAHELRNALAVAMLAFHTLRAGKVGIGGSTASLVDRSLRRLSALVETSIAQVRVDAGKHVQQRVALREIVEDIEVGASIEANALGLKLSVARIEGGVELLVDRQLLVAAVGNLLQNAFKFTHRGGSVSLLASWTENRVLIEVEDRCGGLGSGDTEGLFRPFEQRGANRSGLGLGLSISRKSVEADGGVLRARDLPGTGCVFTIDLPRAPPAL